jgi:tetratricopeptide (TPR) repeat protein
MFRTLRMTLLVLALCVAACDTTTTSTTTPTEPTTEATPPKSQPCRSELSSNHPAIIAWWQALENQDYAARDQVIEDLKAALEAHPDEGEFALSLALAHLWRIAEWDQVEDADFSMYLDSATGAPDTLVRARELCPSDERIAAWLGPMWIRMGQITGSEETLQMGWDVLEEGIAAYPEFVLFSRALVLGGLPADDPDFQGAIDAMWQNFGYCLGEEVDLDNPPAHAFLIAPEDALGDACRNNPRAPHNLEGTAIFYGDLLAKNGDLELARSAYEQGTRTATFKDWPFQDLLHARIADVQARVDAYTDDDPDNDPLWIGDESHQCSVCHAR